MNKLSVGRRLGERGVAAPKRVKGTGRYCPWPKTQLTLQRIFEIRYSTAVTPKAVSTVPIDHDDTGQNQTDTDKLIQAECLAISKQADQCQRNNSNT